MGVIVKKTIESKPVMTRFILGETSFKSRGVSMLRIADSGQAYDLPIPIQSIGVLEAADAVNRRRPKAPVKQVLIRKDTPAGRAMGLAADEVHQVTDNTDDGYLKQMEKWRSDVMWACILPGLDMEFVDPAGKVITDEQRIIDALVAAGITGHHIDQLTKDIGALTKAAEGNADFLSESGSA